MSLIKNFSLWQTTNKKLESYFLWLAPVISQGKNPMSKVFRRRVLQEGDGGGWEECATFSCSLDSGGLHGDAEGERKKKRQRKSAEYKLHPCRTHINCYVCWACHCSLVGTVFSLFTITPNPTHLTLQVLPVGTAPSCTPFSWSWSLNKHKHTGLWLGLDQLESSSEILEAGPKARKPISSY